jgi:sugar (pentulose or hexulose) kinase
MGLMIQPYWTPIVSARQWQGLHHRIRRCAHQGHIYRAILEGLGYELRRQYEFLNAKTGITLREIRVGGAGPEAMRQCRGSRHLQPARL